MSTPERVRQLESELRALTGGLADEQSVIELAGYAMKWAELQEGRWPEKVTVLEQRGSDWSVFAKYNDASEFCGPGDRMETLPVLIVEKV